MKLFRESIFNEGFEEIHKIAEKYTREHSDQLEKIKAKRDQKCRDFLKKKGF